MCVWVYIWTSAGSEKNGKPSVSRSVCTRFLKYFKINEAGMLVGSGGGGRGGTILVYVTDWVTTIEAIKMRTIVPHD